MSFDTPSTEQRSPFDEIVDRSGKWSSKWGGLEKFYGVSDDDAIAMWVADSDFRCGEFILDAARAWVDNGAFGYASDNTKLFSAIQWWMKNRHGWDIEGDWITLMHGLGNAIATAIHAYSEPGDGVVIFSPVYHEFASKIRRADRRVVECPLANRDGRYELDFEAYDALMTGDEKLLLWCSPHNPVGRVWSAEELRAVCDFARRHDLILLSDEIHQDIVHAGNKHTVTALADPSISDRLVTVTAASKTFNVAGMRVGSVIIADEALRNTYNKKARAYDISPNTMGCAMSAAAYSPEGAAWADAQNEYLAGNIALFNAGMNAIPGVRATELEATYLAWVDFSGTGMTFDEIIERVQGRAHVVASHGPNFGTGGETHLRFNMATPRSRVQEAVTRIQEAFSDLQ